MLAEWHSCQYEFISARKRVETEKFGNKVKTNKIKNKKY
jgi:hypothetical protein